MKKPHLIFTFPLNHPRHPGRKEVILLYHVQHISIDTSRERIFITMSNSTYEDTLTVNFSSSEDFDNTVEALYAWLNGEDMYTHQFPCKSVTS